MNIRLEGMTWKFGDDVNTDLVVPGKYLELVDYSEIALHAMEGIDPDFPKKVRKGVSQDVSFISADPGGSGPRGEEAETRRRRDGDGEEGEGGRLRVQALHEGGQRRWNSKRSRGDVCFGA